MFHISGPKLSRRRALRAGAALGSTALLGSVAGCQSDPSGGDGTATTDGPPSGPLATVPASAAYVVSVEVETILNSERVETAAGEVLALSQSSPDTLSELLDQAESRTGLDPRAVSEVVTFGATDGQQFGAVLRTDWSEDDIVSAADDAEADFESDTYNGVTIYESESDREEGGLAVLGDGTFAVGDAATVEAVVDVSQGDADPVSGTVRSAYEASSDGVVQLGFEVPSGGLGDDGPEATVARNTAAGHGSLRIGEDATVTLDLTAESTASAETVAGTLEDELASLEQQAARSSGGSERMQNLTERVVTVIENTTVSRDGRTVTVTTTSGVEAVGTVVGAVVASFVLGLGNSRSQTPTAAFSVAYDDSAETATITHDGGDSIPGSELSIRGTGFQSVSGADMTGPGQWRGTTSGGTDDTAVAAGDSVTIGVRSDYEVRVVWQSAEDSTSATLAAFEGPDA